MLTFKSKFQKTLKSNKKESMQAIFDVQSPETCHFFLLFLLEATSFSDLTFCFFICLSRFK